jgi:hypothetical protein
VREKPGFPRLCDAGVVNRGELQDWMAGGAVADRTRLRANSLQTGNFTGNFAISGLPDTLWKAEATVPQRFWTIPYSD